MPSVFTLYALRTARFIGLLIAFYAVIVYPACGDLEEDMEEIAFEVTPERATLMEGETLQLELLDEFTGAATIAWRSRDESVATVDNNGLVRAEGVGSTVIDVTRFEEDMDGTLQEIISDTVIITVESREGGGDTVIEEGVYTTCSDTESINFLDQCDLADGGGDELGEFSGQCLASISCSEGYQIVDLATQEVQSEGTTSSVGAVFGTIGLKNGDDAALFTYGAQGNILCPASAGFCQLSVGTTTNDAMTAGGDPASGEAAFVGPSRGLQFIEPVSDGSGFGIRKVSIAPGAFQGELVSVWLPATGGTAPLLALTRGTSSFLYEVEGDTPNANPLNFGLDARRVRCEQRSNGTYVCAVSVFGADRVGFTEWTVTNSPTSPSFADVGDGPVGIDIHRTADNRFFVLATGFNDNTITEIEYFGPSTAPNVETRAAAAGCQSPGHGVYKEDTEGLKVVYSCFNSARYVVERSRFE